MNVFQIPIQLIFEDRNTIHACLKDQHCYIKLPLSLPQRERLKLIDRVYWRLICQLHNPALEFRTAQLNQAHFGFTYNKVRFHRQLRRWGSCSSLKNLNLSHRLIEAPAFLVDYVILHELAHLEQLNHGAEFKKLLKNAAGGVSPQTVKQAIINYGRSWNEHYQNWISNIAALEKQKVNK